MLTSLDVILLIALALVFARLLGFIFDRCKQPAVIGEIVAGILLGGIGVFFLSNELVTVFDIHIPALNFTSPEFHLFAEIGILFLLFISGLETSFSQLKKTEKSSTYVAIGGVLVPLFLGFLVGFLAGFSISESIVIGLILVATSVGVTVRSLLDINALDSDVGSTILGSAVIDDVIGIILLAIVLGIDSPVSIVIKIGLFFFIFLYIGLKIIGKVLDLGEKIHLPKAFLSIALAIFLIYSFFAYTTGIAGIIGAFVAGLLIGHNLKTRKIVDDIQAIGYGFFVPLFFVWVGARLWEGDFSNLSAFNTLLLLSLILIGIGIIGKILGCGIGAKLAGMTNKESLQIGIGMIPRMELALIIASTAATNQNLVANPILGHQMLTATIILTIVTAILTPILIKAAFKHN